MAGRRRLRRVDFVMLPILSLLAIFAVWLGAERQTMRLQIATRVVDGVAASGLLKRQVGTPIRVGFLVSGKIYGGMDMGTADLTIPISGPKGRGRLLAWLQNSFVGWHVCSMTFRPTSGPDVVLAPDETAHCERE